MKTFYLLYIFSTIKRDSLREIEPDVLALPSVNTPPCSDWKPIDVATAATAVDLYEWFIYRTTAITVRRAIWVRAFCYAYT